VTTAAQPAWQSDPFVAVAGQDVGDTFQTKLDRLGLQTQGPSSRGEMSSQCPAHDDNSPSLRWRVAASGRLVLHCHASCEYDAITNALEMKPWELEPVRTEFLYTDPQGQVTFGVRREYAMGESAKRGFLQGRYVGGNWVAGRDPSDCPDWLWRMPEVVNWGLAGQSSGGDTDGELYICEGESDAMTLSWALRQQGIACAEGGSFRAVATTAPNGAKHWNARLTRQVMAACSERAGRDYTDDDLLEMLSGDTPAEDGPDGAGIKLRIVVDRDPAGYKRGADMSTAMREAADAVGLTGISVELLTPTEVEKGEWQPKDVRGIIDKLTVADVVRGVWQLKLGPPAESAHSGSTALIQGWDSIQYGGWTRAVAGRLGPGEAAYVLSVADSDGQASVKRLDADIVPLAWAGDTDQPLLADAWEVEVRMWTGTSVVTHRVWVTAADFSSAAATRAWLVKDARVSWAANAKEAIGDAGPGLRKYLAKSAADLGAPKVVRTWARGWVDALTGESAPWDAITAGTRLAYIAPLARGVGPAQDAAVAYIGADQAPGDPDTLRVSCIGDTDDSIRFGLGDAEDARRYCAEALTYAVPTVTGPAIAWSVVTLLWPWFAHTGLPIRPGLAAAAGSGRGKSNGALGRVLGMAGCARYENPTVAGLRRTLLDCVGVVRWVDDTSSLLDSDGKEILRACTTNSSRTQGNQDRGAKGVDRLTYGTAPCLSMEDVGAFTEVAMRQRFVQLDLPDPTSRKSQRPGAPSHRSQAADMQDTAQKLGRKGGFTAYAGTFLRGLLDLATVYGDAEHEAGRAMSPGVAGAVEALVNEGNELADRLGARGRDMSMVAAIWAGARLTEMWLSELPETATGAVLRGTTPDLTLAIRAWLPQWLEHADEAAFSGVICDDVLPWAYTTWASGVKLPKMQGRDGTGGWFYQVDPRLSDLTSAGMLEVSAAVRGAGLVAAPAVIMVGDPSSMDVSWWVSPRILEGHYLNGAGRARAADRLVRPGFATRQLEDLAKVEPLPWQVKGDGSVSECRRLIVDNSRKQHTYYRLPPRAVARALGERHKVEYPEGQA